MTGFDKPNYTQVPNLLLDVLMADMTESELKIVLVAVRKIIGYHKDRDAISFSQFEKMSGLSRPAVQDGLNRALEHGWIIKADTGARKVGIYTLAIREDASLVKNSNQLKNATSSSKKSLPMTGKKSLPTKETENKTKETPPNPRKRGNGNGKVSERDKTIVMFRQLPIASILWGYFGNGIEPERLTIATLNPYIKAAQDLAMCGATVESVQRAYTNLARHAVEQEWTKQFGLTGFLKHYPEMVMKEYYTTAPAQPFDLSEWHINEFNPEEMES